VNVVDRAFEAMTARLESATLTRCPLPGLSADLAGPDDAYAVQRALNERWMAHGRRQVGC
jgi:2-keto-4-pentenoate hydratase